MIKVFIYENYSELSGYFQEEDYNIPFLGSTLLDFVFESYEVFSRNSNVDFKFYVPKPWEGLGFDTYSSFFSELSDDFELIIITDLFTLPILELSKDEYFFFKQRPGKFFSHGSGIKVGYVNKNTDFSNIETSEDTNFFPGVVGVNEKNFLRLNSSLVSRINFDVTSVPGTYGNPIILCSPDSIVNSKICGPCFIGDDAHIVNSKIYPGTIITGRTTIQNSEIFESFVCASKIVDSKINNSLVALSNFEGLDLDDSIIPRGSKINNVRNR